MIKFSKPRFKVTLYIKAFCYLGLVVKMQPRSSFNSSFTAQFQRHTFKTHERKVSSSSSSLQSHLALNSLRYSKFFKLLQLSAQRFVYPIAENILRIVFIVLFLSSLLRVRIQSRMLFFVFGAYLFLTQNPNLCK